LLFHKVVFLIINYLISTFDYSDGKYTIFQRILTYFANDFDIFC